MESNIYDFESLLNELELKKLIITIIKVYNNNFYKNLNEFFNLFKIRVLIQTIYENKYFINYKRLYALRNIIIRFSLKLYGNNNFKKIIFNDWHNKTGIPYLKNDYFKIKKIIYLRKIILNLLMKNIKIKNNSKSVKKYFLLLMKYYNYLIDNYYIRSILLAKSLFNYVRKKIKKYKSKFFSIIDFNLTEEDKMNIYKHILINYNKDNFNDNNKNKLSLDLIKTYNKTIKHNYDNLINYLLEKNNIYIILYKFIFNKFLSNKNICFIFSKWKEKNIDESLIYYFNAKEKYVNNLIFSKIFLLILVIKNIIKKYFEIFYNNIYKKQTNGLILVDYYELISILNFESIYDNYLINILKGYYKIQNFKNKNYTRIFKMNDKNKKLICFNIWKNNKNIICTYYNNNINLFDNNKIDIIKASLIFDKIYLKYNNNNKKIKKIINLLLNHYSNNLNKKNKYLRLNILFEILNTILINKRKNIYNLFLDIFKLSEDEKIIKKELSLFISIIQNILLIKNYKYKIYFFNILKNSIHYNDIFRQKKSNYKNIIKYNNNKIGQNIIMNNIEDTKLLALNKILKYFINNSIKNNFSYSLKNMFNYWSSLIGYCPNILKEKIDNNYNNESEDEEDIITQRKEIKELQKCLKEDKDFQHDLKLKITALDEENTFICEKIFEITQRVENCEKCSNLLKSSNKTDNVLKSSYGSAFENNNNNNGIQTRNVAPGIGTISSGLNFVSDTTELVPKKPQGSLNIYEEASDPGSEQFEDIDENMIESNRISQPYLIGLKQKIIDLKKEKEPIINKLKEEIKELYLELNMI